LTFSPAHLSRAVPLVVSCALHVALGGVLAAMIPTWTAPPAPRVLEAEIVKADRPAPTPEVEPPRPRLTAPRPTTLPRLIEAPKPVAPEPPAPAPTPAPVVAPPVAPAASPAPAPSPSREPFAIAATEPPGAPGELKATAERPAPPAPVVAKAPPEEPITRLATPSGGYQVRPSYPSTARRLGIEGTSLLLIYVAADGRVTEVQVDQTAGHPDLDRAAMDAVRRWKFEPGRRGSEPVGMWVRLPVQFVLK
jgi:protein TonB